MDLSATKTGVSDIIKIAFLLGLVIVFLGVLTWVNIIPSDAIPGWRSLYDSIYLGITGKQEMLIVFGNDGLGDELKLQQLIRDPQVLGKIVSSKHISLINAGNLSEYDVVIVTHAKTLSSAQLEYFMDYVNAGGKLVWTADAGTGLTSEDSLLSEGDLDINGDLTKNFGVWARKKDDKVIRFDELLGLKFVANYCSIQNCNQGPLASQGQLVSSSENHSLVFGLRPDALLYGDFSIVQETGGIGNRRVLSLDHGSAIVLDNDPNNQAIPGMPNTLSKDLGKVFPTIVTSGFGEKVVYYSQPLENFVSKGTSTTTGQSEFKPATLLLTRLYKTLRK